MGDFAEKVRSLGVSRPERRAAKVVTDVHDGHTVTTTEHWDDRVDVHVKGPKGVRA